MSGGHYEYAYFKIDNLASSIKEDIDRNDIPDEYGFKHNFSEKTMDNMKKLHAMLIVSAKLAKEAEWLYSGDTGEDQFNSEFSNLVIEK